MTLYRVRGFFAYLRGNKAWGEISRVGFTQVAAVASGEREKERV